MATVNYPLGSAEDGLITWSLDYDDTLSPIRVGNVIVVNNSAHPVTFEVSLISDPTRVLRRTFPGNSTTTVPIPQQASQRFEITPEVINGRLQIRNLQINFGG